MSQVLGAIAATRFGMGARPGEISEAASDPRGWLKAQIRPEAALTPAGDLKSAQEVLGERRESYQGMRPGELASGEASPELVRAVEKTVQREIRQGLAKEAAARAAHGAATPDGFAERWARFWANHFTMAARNAQTIGLAGPFEREAIRPNVFGSFAALLAAATFHPGMLVYLDANRSIGPSTQAAKRRGAGLNENLAREILELHTLGVGSGYSQDDIIELAKALTGWTVSPGGGAGGRPGGGLRARALRDLNDQMAEAAGEAMFIAPLHEPGARNVLGKRYAATNQKQAPAILDDLAGHTATARHVAVKLARHFVADAPPEAAVATLETAFRQSEGDLAVLARAVIDLDAGWGEAPAKFRTPDELLTATARASDVRTAFGANIGDVYRALAQQPFGAPSPAGWPDEAAAWAGPDAIMKRLEWANAVAARARGSTSPTVFLDQALGPLAGERTRTSVARAETAAQGLTLALMSPEFQRR